MASCPRQVVQGTAACQWQAKPISLYQYHFASPVKVIFETVYSFEIMTDVDPADQPAAQFGPQPDFAIMIQAFQAATTEIGKLTNLLSIAQGDAIIQQLQQIQQQMLQGSQQVQQQMQQMQQMVQQDIGDTRGDIQELRNEIQTQHKAS
jgi:hypothetical protein